MVANIRLLTPLSGSPVNSQRSNLQLRKNLHVHVHVCHAQVTSTVFRTKPFFCFGGFLHMNIEYDRHHGMCVKIEIFINF
jgi:hypothetical protein